MKRHFQIVTMVAAVSITFLGYALSAHSQQRGAPAAPGAAGGQRGAPAAAGAGAAAGGQRGGQALLVPVPDALCKLSSESRCGSCDPGNGYP